MDFIAAHEDVSIMTLFTSIAKQFCAFTSVQKFRSISLKADKLWFVKSGVNVPSSVAVPGKRRAAQAMVVSLSPVLNEMLLYFLLLPTVITYPCNITS